MTLIAQRTITGAEVRPNVTLDRRRRRLSGVVYRHVDRARPHIVSVHRRGEALAPCSNCIKLRKEWRGTLVGPQDVVIITYLPQGGGGGGGSSIVMAVAAIALMVVVPWAIGALGAGTFLTTAAGGLSFAGKLLATGIVMGGMALLSMANKPKANKSDDNDRPIYGVSGGGNLPRPGDRIPRLYGRCWTSPDLSQPDYYSYSGETQTLYKLMTITAGRAVIHSIRVSGQLAWTAEGGVRAPFSGLRVEVVNPGELCTLVPNDVVTSPAVQGLELPRPDSTVGDWSGPFVVSGPGTTVNKIQLDISAPQGSLYNASNSKGAYEAAVPLGWEFQYAPVNEAGVVFGSWKRLDLWSKQILSRRPLRYTRTIRVPEGRYAVRGRNLHTNTPPNDKVTNITNGLQWDALRGHRPGTRVRSNVTQVALQIKSNASLGVTSFADVQIEATGVVPVWNGSSWVNTATRKAVWIYADIMRNTVYGGAIPDSAFDKETAKFYADTLTKFDTFDGVIRGPDSVWNAASVALFPMRAEPVQLGRIWSLVRDEPKATRRHVITARQIVSDSSAIAFDTDPGNGDAHIIAEFDYGGDPTRPRELPDIYYGTKSLTPTRRKLFGVSSQSHATHIARWLAASAFYRRQRKTFSTEHEGRIYKRGDSIAVESWFSTLNKLAGILGVSGQTLTLDCDVPYASGDHITLRDRTGREWGPILLTGQGASTRQVVMDASSRAAMEASTGLLLSDVLTPDTMEITTAVIGQRTTLQRNYLVRAAKPSARDKVDVEVVIDAPQVWDAIDAPVAEDPDDSDVPTNDITPPSDLKAVERIYSEGGTAKSALDVSWTRSPDPRAIRYEAEYRFVSDPPEVGLTDPDTILEEDLDDELWVSAGAPTEDATISITDLPPGLYDLRVRALYSSMERSLWVEKANIAVQGLTVAPSDVTGFAIAVLGDSARLTWNPVADAHLRHYEIRFSPLVSGVTWGTAVTLVPETTATTEPVPARVGTYLIKAVSQSGTPSANAAVIVSQTAAISALNAVEARAEQPAFAGVMSNVIRDESLGGLVLVGSADVFAFDDVFAADLDVFMGSDGVASEGIYSFAGSVDLQDVFTSRLSAVIEATGITLSDDIFTVDDVFALEDAFQVAAAAQWDVVMEYRTTNDDPAGAPVWSAWKPVVIGDVTARAYQFQARLLSYQFDVTPLVTRLEVTIDMPDRIEAGNDLPVPASGLRVNFDPPFLALKGLAFNEEGLQPGDQKIVSNKSESGFDIQFVNGGAPVVRAIDFVASGYGRKIA